MATGYHHLSYEERCQIHALRKRADSLREIARQLGRSPSTISRELHRNSGGRGYRYQQATRLASGRRRKASLRPRKMTEAMWSLVREKLALHWSPEQVSGRLRRDGVVSVSTTWIYRHSWADRAAGGSLYKLLRRRGKRYNRRNKSGAGRGLIPHRVDISERDPIVEQKTRIGDWEVDTIIGAKQQGALVSMVDRASKFTFLEHVASKAAIGVRHAIIGCLSPVKDRRTYYHGGQWQGVRSSSADRQRAFRIVLLCEAIPLLGAWSERAHQRPGARVLPEGNQLSHG